MEKNRSIIRLLYGSLLLVLVTLGSCTTKPGDLPDDPNLGKGVVRPFGKPIGNIISKSIGPEGGTIISADGGIEINVPAGAVSSNTTIFIQAITNTNQCGKGTAYRLTPHMQFIKPVTVKFNYTDEQVSCSEALGIAYQDNEGKWKAVGGVVVDAVNKTITAKTTHFSDWSFFEAFSLLPEKSYINPGEKVSLKITYFLETEDGLLLVPLIPEKTEVYLTEGKELQSKYIDEWKLVGEGNLVPQGAKAEYTAPAKIPANNPAVISVRIKDGSNAVGLLISRVFVAPEGVSLKINGGEWITMPMGMVQSAAGVYNIMADKAGSAFPFVNIIWRDPVLGEKNWKIDESIKFGYKPNEQSEYNHFYISGDAAIPSPGSLNITQYGKAGEYVLGTFTVKKSGLISTNSLPMVANIEGVIRIKRLK